MVNRTSKQVRKQLILRYLEGASVRKISQETRVHRDTISRILDDYFWNGSVDDDDAELPNTSRRADANLSLANLDWIGAMVDKHPTLMAAEYADVFNHHHPTQPPIHAYDIRRAFTVRLS